jgi:hypothetical protein
MRTSFHHQPEAQHPNFQLSTRWSADYPIFRSKADMPRGLNAPNNVRFWRCVRCAAPDDAVGGRLPVYHVYRTVPVPA